MFGIVLMACMGVLDRSFFCSQSAFSAMMSGVLSFFFYISAELGMTVLGGLLS